MQEIIKAKYIKKLILVAGMLLFMSGGAEAQVMEWASVNGGGSTTTGGGNTLVSSVSQTALGTAVGGTTSSNGGFLVSWPDDAAVYCQNGGVACSTATCYGPLTNSFIFMNNMCGTAPGAACSFKKGTTQYYQYLWQTSAAYTHAAIMAAADWGDTAAMCPGGACTQPAASMTLNPSSTSNTWYLIARSYNGGQPGSADGLLENTDAVMGPYKYDASGDTIGGTITPANTNYTTTFVDGTFDISVGSISAVGCAAISSCDYTINGGTAWNAATYAAGTCSKTSAVCADGAALTINMRVTDANSNVTTGTAVTRTCDAAAPTAGTITPASTATALYVDGTFNLSATFNDGTGSQVASCEYCKSVDGVCDTEWAAGSWAAGSCSTTGLTCTTGQTVSLNMRATDNVTNLGTGTLVSRTCDATAPTCSISAITETNGNTYATGTARIVYGSAGAGGFSVTVSATDATSGVQKVNFQSPGSGITGCGDDASSPYTCAFTYTAAASYNSSVTETSYDNVGNTQTCSFNAVLDNTAPTGGSISFTDGWYTSTSVAITFASGTDAVAGIASRSIQRDEATLANGTGNCNAFPGTWGTSFTPASTPYTDATVTSGKCYQYRFIVTDNVGNTATYTTASVAKIDTAAPTAIPNCAAISLYDTSAKAATLVWGSSYSYTGPNSPYMEWTNPGDNPAGNNSGVAGYYLYFGTNSGADPQTSGLYQAGAATSSMITLAAGTSYYFITKTKDAAGNISSASTACQYRYSSGGYLTITQFDTDGTSYGADLGSADNPEGIVAPNNSDFEIILVKVVDESDSIITTGPVSTKQVTLTLSNVGGTGAYIASTGLTGATCTPGPGVISCAGNLVAGVGWIKIKANGTAPATDQDAVIITPTASGLSGQGGRNQIVSLLVRNIDNVSLPIITVDTVGTPDSGQLVFNPAWNATGDSIAYMSKASGAWNIYKKTYSGGVWGASTALTNSSMSLNSAGAFTWSADGTYVVFSASDTVNFEQELYAVKADGSDAAKTQAQLDAASQKLTTLAYNINNRRKWIDSDWSPSSCGNGYGDRIVASMSQIVSRVILGQDLFMMSGSKTGGLYVETGGTPATITQLTNFPGNFPTAMMPRWSHDCSKIAFVVLDNVAVPSKTSVYIMNVTDTAWAPAVAAFPVTSLSATGMYKIYECSAANGCPLGAAVFPSFSADNSTLFLAVDTSGSVDIRGLQSNDITGSFYTGKNFDNYAIYVGTNGSYTTQKIGQPAHNEFGITQCYGASCPNAALGKPITYVSQSSATTGNLLVASLSNESTITANGGLMFMSGAVTAVFPPGAVATDTRLAVATPSLPAAGSCGTYNTDCTNLLVSTGEARDFYPDGVIFNTDIQLVFHYCDTDGDGYLDTRQDATCSGATGGSSGVDENSLYIYYWCDANGSATTRHCTQNQWQQLNGSIDSSGNSITVITNHFSLYDLKAMLRTAMQAGNFAPVNLSNPHTFPNPWRSTDGLVNFNIDGNSTFTTTDINPAGGRLDVNVEIHDINGRLVRTLSKTLTGLSNASLNGGPSVADNPSGVGLNLISWDARNNAGRPVASGVYLYHMTVSDGWSTRGVTGKLAIVK